MDSNLNIDTWNCRSTVSNLSLFKVFLYSYKPHIVCLCETWLKPSRERSFINYFSIWTHRAGPQRGGGIAFLIRNDIHHSQKALMYLTEIANLKFMQLKL